MDPRRSDNLYSADDETDADSFSEELTPADGYFERRQMPSEPINLPPPPEEEESKGKAKASEAWQEALDNTKYLPTDSRLLARPATSSRTTYSPSPSGQSLFSASARGPSPGSSPPLGQDTQPRHNSNMYLVNTDPPPAYTPATTTNSPTSLSSPTQHQAPSIAHSDSPSPRQVEEGLLPLLQEPQSMGAPEGGPNERTPLWNNTLRSNNRIKNNSRRAFIRRFLLLALFAVLISGFINAMYNLGKHVSNEHFLYICLARADFFPHKILL